MHFFIRFQKNMTPRDAGPSDVLVKAVSDNLQTAIPNRNPFPGVKK